MSMPPTREGAFNPTSPHSSSGAADSFKGTPDTRLTAFSPEDGSSKSARVPHTLGLSGGRGPGPVRFPVASPASLDLSKAKASYRGSLTIEKDPFVSSTGLMARPMQKLSPTASCFSPFSRAPVARGSTTELAPIGFADGAMPIVARDLSFQDGNHGEFFVHNNLSTDIGISRCLAVESAGKPIQVADIEHYLTVSFSKAPRWLEDSDLTINRVYRQLGCRFRVASIYKSLLSKATSGLVISAMRVYSPRTPVWVAKTGKFATLLLVSSLRSVKLHVLASKRQY